MDGYGPVYDIYDGYADGYGSSDAIVIAGDWNHRRRYSEDPSYGSDAPCRVAAVLESLGADVVWHDEYVGCADCYRAIRVTPNYYGDRPAYSWIDYEPVCAGCIRENPAGYIDAYINNPQNAVTFDVDLSELGFVVFEPGDPHIYETGWHPGQDDDPERVLSDIRDYYAGLGIGADDVDVVFDITAVGQFDLSWRAHVRISETVSS